MYVLAMYKVVIVVNIHWWNCAHCSIVCSRFPLYGPTYCGLHGLPASL